MKHWIHLVWLSGGIVASHAQDGPGFALGFDGVNDHVSVAHTDALDPYPLTVAAWFRTTQTTAAMGLVAKFRHTPFAARGGWQLHLADGNLHGLYDYSRDSALEMMGGFVADGAWHHAAFTVGDSGATLYVDGVLRQFVPWEGAPIPAGSTASMRIGTDGASGFFAGTMDEVTVWNVEQNEFDIQANMRRSLAGSEPGLIAYYRFNEGFGSVTADSAPAAGNNNGSLVGGPAWVPPVATLRPDEFGPSSAALKGSAIPILTNASMWFEWGLTTNYGNVTPPQPLSGTNSDFSCVITGLNLSDTYHFRAALSNNFGVAFGADESFSLPPFGNIHAGLPGIAFGSLAWGDYDNDGRLDLLSAGHPTNQTFSFLLNVELWRNSGRGFTNVSTALGLDNVTAWGDYNNDGRLDIPVMPVDPNQFTSQRPIPVQLDIPAPRVLRNTGDEFTNLNGRLGWWIGSAAFGDYDNDGRVDLLRTGSALLSDLRRASTTFGETVYYPLNDWAGITEQLWRNTGDGLVHIDAGFPAVSHGSVAWGDYDNDGRLDVLLCGVTNGVAICQIWRNTGSGFTNIHAGLPGIAYGAAAWGDYDNDGRLDILLAGATGLLQYDTTPEGFPVLYHGPFHEPGALFFGVTPSLPDGGFPTGLAAQVWRNTGNGFTNIEAGLPGVWSGSVAWGDYDNDGRADILLIGATTTLTMGYEGFGGTNVQGWPTGFVAQLWRNTGNGFTNVNAGLPGAGYSSAVWGDYDNDGRLDIALAGATSMFTRYVTNSGLFGGSYIIYPTVVASDFITQIWQNFSPSNSRPAAPAGLAATTAGGAVTFTWNASTDPETPASGLTYNLRVGTTPGSGDLVEPMALGDGVRLLPQFGNAGQRLSRTVTGLPLGQPLYWSVQAVDNGFAGSPFGAEQRFTLHSVFNPSNGVPGDLNGDGIVSQSEFAAVLQNLNGSGIVSESDLLLVLSNYFPHSPWLQMTNVAGLGGTNVSFVLTSSLAGAFSVEVTTNLADWLFLGPATPRYEFTDTNAPAEPQRYYRLRWP